MNYKGIELLYVQHIIGNNYVGPSEHQTVLVWSRYYLAWFSRFILYKLSNGNPNMAHTILLDFLFENELSGVTSRIDEKGVKFFYSSQYSHEDSCEVYYQPIVSLLKESLDIDNLNLSFQYFKTEEGSNYILHELLNLNLLWSCSNEYEYLANHIHDNLDATLKSIIIKMLYYFICSITDRVMLQYPEYYMLGEDEYEQLRIAFREIMLLQTELYEKIDKLEFYQVSLDVIYAECNKDEVAKIRHMYDKRIELIEARKYLKSIGKSIEADKLQKELMAVIDQCTKPKRIYNVSEEDTFIKRIEALNLEISIIKNEINKRCNKVYSFQISRIKDETNAFYKEVYSTRGSSYSNYDDCLYYFGYSKYDFDNYEYDFDNYEYGSDDEEEEQMNELINICLPDAVGQQTNGNTLELLPDDYRLEI